MTKFICPGRLFKGVANFFFTFSQWEHRPAKFCPGPTIRFKVIDEIMSAKPVSAKEKKKTKNGEFRPFLYVPFTIVTGHKNAPRVRTGLPKVVRDCLSESK